MLTTEIFLRGENVNKHSVSERKQQPLAREYAKLRTLSLPAQNSICSRQVVTSGNYKEEIYALQPVIYSSS